MLYASGMWAWHMLPLLLLPPPLYCCQIQFNCQQQYEVGMAGGMGGKGKTKKGKTSCTQTRANTHTHRHKWRHSHTHTHTLHHSHTHSATLACGHKHKQAPVLGLGLDRFTHNLRNFRPPARPQHTPPHTRTPLTHTHTHVLYNVPSFCGQHLCRTCAHTHTHAHWRTICRPFVDICTLTAHPPYSDLPPSLPRPTTFAVGRPHI